MSGRVHADAKAAPKASFGPVRTGLLQRKSLLDGVIGMAGEFTDSRGKRLVSQPPLVQTKLTINQPNDRYEQEADRVADTVIRMPEPDVSNAIRFGSIQRACIGCGEGELRRQLLIQTKTIAEQITPFIQRQVEEEEEILQTKAYTGQVSEVTSDIASRIQSLKGGGQPLSETTRAFFESRFGQDFNQVRVHTNSQAANTAQAINSKAFTVGRDVVFGVGQYSPETAIGKRLLAHELTHVIQQRIDANKPHLQLKPLTEAEKQENLKSQKYVGNRRLQKAFDNDPPLGIGESGGAVRLVQEGLVADGFAMPRSTKPTGEMDGGFGAETFETVRKFQAKHGLSVDGVVGHETTSKLDELAQVKPLTPPSFLPPCPPGTYANTSAFSGAMFSDIPVAFQIPGLLCQLGLYVPILEELKIIKKIDPPRQDDTSRLFWAFSPDNAPIIVETGVNFEAKVKANGANGNVFFVQNVIRTNRRKNGCSGAVGTDKFSDNNTPFTDGNKGYVYGGHKNSIVGAKSVTFKSSDFPASSVTTKGCPNKKWPKNLDVCLSIGEIFRLYCIWEMPTGDLMLLGHRGWAWSIEAVSPAPGAKGKRDVILKQKFLWVQPGPFNTNIVPVTTSPVITADEIESKHFTKISKNEACSSSISQPP